MWLWSIYSFFAALSYQMVLCITGSVSFSPPIPTPPPTPSPTPSLTPSPIPFHFSSCLAKTSLAGELEGKLSG